jgi:cytochrome b6-f complex iron-sulfur subunit
MNKQINLSKRRKFFKYMIGGTSGILAIGWLFPETARSNQHGYKNEDYYSCPSFDSSECAFHESASEELYAQGKLIEALDAQGESINPSSLLAEIKPGNSVAVRGLSLPTYLVIEQGPKIASYGVLPVCSHKPHRVKWNAKLDRFVCPEHGAQFNYKGHVMKGPAKHSLPSVKVITESERIFLVNE